MTDINNGTDNNNGFTDRMSQIEKDINQMNEMLQENLNINQQLNTDIENLDKELKEEEKREEIKYLKLKPAESNVVSAASNHENELRQFLEDYNKEYSSEDTNKNATSTTTSQRIGDYKNVKKIDASKVPFIKKKSPFRVISVNSTSRNSSSTRTSSVNSNSSIETNASSIHEEEQRSFEKNKRKSSNDLQELYDQLNVKVHKVEKEIRYLKKVVKERNLTVEDASKLNEGIEKLEGYLDKKIKQRYEVGLQLTRGLRNRVISDNNGFFVGKS
ncbi:Bni5p SCDLUD_002952 [Saccharomycodes ludwigii]|uniref:Bni5p n=1 Tax=Saccharomycodes ludwigii TaxID=36035 RepID=UPI001E880302|nr:hypothetical protein SCDLUD_002952 [Saccharomycodes ludwigii]KAH3901457.1 hypothetical protein SCDLUD_002952 [Saccharomycodes ludwigii]